MKIDCCACPEMKARKKDREKYTMKEKMRDFERDHLQSHMKKKNDIRVRITASK